jgi:hypothetical protein
VRTERNGTNCSLWCQRCVAKKFQFCSESHPFLHERKTMQYPGIDSEKKNRRKINYGRIVNFVVEKNTMKPLWIWKLKASFRTNCGKWNKNWQRVIVNFSTVVVGWKFTMEIVSFSMVFFWVDTVIFGEADISRHLNHITVASFRPP